jgi:hypothetical protein
VGEGVYGALDVSGSGNVLPEATRQKMEGAFGTDFSSVRVHEGSHVAQLGGLAYTQGTDVHFAAGKYRPGTPAGDRLIGHELTHVIQQSGGRVPSPQGTDSPVVRDKGLEQEADRLGELAAEGKQVSVLGAAGASAVLAKEAEAVQCKEGPIQLDEPKEPETGPTAQEMALANSVYNKVVASWGFLAQRQVLAVRSIYTEAQKPSKPSLLEEVLITLAEAALSGALGGFGGLIVMAVEKQVAKMFVSSALKAGAGRFRDAAGRFVTTEVGIKTAELASKKTATFVSEFAKYAMKDGIESLAKPKIKEALSEGKEPIDAFFEGQMNALVDAGKKGSDAAEDKRRDVMADPNPIQTAQGMYDGMNQIYDAAEEAQKSETLRNWLIYQSRVDTGVVEKGTTGEGTTNLAGEAWPSRWPWSTYIPGTLYVVIDRNLNVKKAHLKGSTAHMVALLEKTPINKLGIPVILDFDWPGVKDFYINVNERGFLWLVPRNGGAGNTFLRIQGGAHEVTGYDPMQGTYTGWIGGDPIQGAFSLWFGGVGSQTVEGKLPADK